MSWLADKLGSRVLAELADRVVGSAAPLRDRSSFLRRWVYQPAGGPVLIPARHRRSALWVAIALLALMLALRGWLQWVAPLPGDRLLLTLRGHRMPLPVRAIDRGFDDLGGPVEAVVTVLVTFCVLLRSVSRRAALGAVLASGVVFASMLIKGLCGSTPLWLMVAPDAPVDYPSGHTAYAASLFGYIAVFAWGCGRRRLAIVAVLIVCGMGIERIVSGVHLFSDVIGGYLLGAGWLIFVILAVHSDDGKQ